MVSSVDIHWSVTQSRQGKVCVACAKQLPATNKRLASLSNTGCDTDPESLARRGSLDTADDDLATDVSDLEFWVCGHFK
jgi:hypothetical protein